MVVATEEDDQRWADFEAGLADSEAVSMAQVPFPSTTRSGAVQPGEVDNAAYKRPGVGLGVRELKGRLPDQYSI